MANKPYNGFPAEQRTRAGKWYRARVRSGKVKVAETCCLCSSRVKVAGHSEDYSEPFGPHIGAFDLCWLCHMMIHCRRRNPKRWADYIEHLEAGYMYEKPLDWTSFTMLFLGPTVPKEWQKQRHEPRVLIRDISMGLYNPNEPGGRKYWFPEDKRPAQESLI